MSDNIFLIEPILEDITKKAINNTRFNPIDIISIIIVVFEVYKCLILIL